MLNFLVLMTAYYCDPFRLFFRSFAVTFSLFIFAFRCGQLPVFSEFVSRSFWDCKGKNLFVIPKFYFFFFLGPLFSGFLSNLMPFSSFVAGCKGEDYFPFCQVLFSLF